MKARHATQLMNRLERVFTEGTCVITPYELRFWYGDGDPEEKKRVTKAIWRDIDDRWTEIASTDDEDIPLFVAHSPIGWMFLWAEGLTTDGSWWEKVKDKADRDTGDSEEDE